MSWRIRIESTSGIEFRDAVGSADALDEAIRAEFGEVPCGITIMARS